MGLFPFAGQTPNPNDESPRRAAKFPLPVALTPVSNTRPAEIAKRQDLADIYAGIRRDLASPALDLRQFFHIPPEMLRHKQEAVDPVRGPKMSTFLGGSYYPLDPREDEVFIEDIAHGMSQVCRFAGQCIRFYSDAEHSVHASFLVDPEHALAALLHDAPEAYLADFITPIKKHPSFVHVYRALEAKSESCIFNRFGLSLPMHPQIKIVDNLLCDQEFSQNVAGHLLSAGSFRALPLQFWSHEEAEARFLQRFYEMAPEFAPDLTRNDRHLSMPDF